MPWPIPPTEPRSREALERHYAIETQLADRLRRAAPGERRRLYSEVYDEFFRRVTDLPRLDEDGRRHAVALQAGALEPFLRPDGVFLEVGAGDCALALHLASRVRRVVAVDASAEAVAGLERPGNFELVVSDRIPLDLDDGSVDVAYSCHFLEHLHPDDVREHAAEMRRVLVAGGAYVCVTPNRVWGPHDISRYFDDAPTGFHLHETTHGELARLLRRAGFRRVEALRGVGRPPRRAAVWPYALAEHTLDLLPPAWRRRVLTAVLGRRGTAPLRPLEQVTVVATV